MSIGHAGQLTKTNVVLRPDVNTSQRWLTSGSVSYTTPAITLDVDPNTRCFDIAWSLLGKLIGSTRSSPVSAKLLVPSSDSATTVTTVIPTPDIGMEESTTTWKGLLTGTNDNSILRSAMEGLTLPTTFTLSITCALQGVHILTKGGYDPRPYVITAKGKTKLPLSTTVLIRLLSSLKPTLTGIVIGNTSSYPIPLSGSRNTIPVLPVTDGLRFITKEITVSRATTVSTSSNTTIVQSKTIATTLSRLRSVPLRSVST